MQRGEVTAKLKQHEADLRRLGVEHLFLFGSTARNEARLDSDLDLFFDYPRGTFGLYELIDVKDAAASILGCKADLMTRDSIHKRLRASIEAEAILMAKRPVSLRLDGMIEPAERVSEVLGDLPIETLEADRQRDWLLERGIEIISESGRYLLRR